MGSRSKHVTQRRVSLGQPVRLTAKEQLQRRVRMLRAEVVQLEARLSRVTAAVRNDVLGLEIDLDAVKYVLVAIQGCTPEQWQEARDNAVAICEMRVASQAAGVGLRHWFMGATADGMAACDRAERHYHPERFATPPDQEHDHGTTHVHAHADG